MQNEIHIKREDLYEQVWSTPMTKLAKEYQISDVGLAKICKKLKIPVPGRGYWATNRQKKKPLLPSLRGIPDSVIHKIRHDIPQNEKAENDEVQSLISFEQQPENLIRVPEKLYSPHQLVALTKQSLKMAHASTYGSPRIFPEKCLDVRICKGSIDRAMRIYDALIKAFEKRGFNITINKSTGVTTVTVMGEPLEIRLEEPVAQVERELTKEEKKKVLQGGWVYNRYVHRPSGRLILKINEWLDGLRKNWSDGKKYRLEDILNLFIIGLIKAAARSKERILEREKREQERRAREEQIRLKAEQIQREKEKIQGLMRNAEAWYKSQQIRSYIDAVRQTVTQKHGSIVAGSEIDEWLSWATQQADRLDPLVKSPPSILNEEKKFGSEYGFM
jgi:hypothetical protein